LQKQQQKSGCSVGNIHWGAGSVAAMSPLAAHLGGAYSIFQVLLQQGNTEKLSVLCFY
jgi:hypothetical protein